MLVARGAKLDIPDHRGNTPRTLAIQSDDADLAAYLHSKWKNNRYYKTELIVNFTGQEQFQMISSDDGTSV